MAGRYDPNPFEEEEVNPFANGSTFPPASNSRPSLTPESAGFFNDRGATVDIPLDSTKDLRKKEKELQAKEADLRKREQEVKRKEDAAARAGVVLEEKNWPPFFPIIHHDIAKEIPVHVQRMQYLAFASLLAVDIIGDSTIVGIFYFIGFGFFCIESLLSIWVLQQVYMYFRGTGKAAQMKREAARGAMRAAI